MAYTRTYQESVNYPATSTLPPAKPVDRSVVRVMTGSRSGERVPDWKEKIRLGLNASSPFTSSRIKRQNATSNSALLAYKYDNIPNKVYTELYEGYAPVGPGDVSHLTGTTLSVANSTALTQIYKKMNEGLSHMNAPGAVLEFMGVVHMFGSPARAIINLTNRHLNRVYLQTRGISAINKNKEKIHKIVAASYLEYAFGLQPLISDTKKAAEALARWEYESSGESRFRSRVVGRGDSVKAETVQTTIVLPGTMIRAISNSKHETKVRVQYVCGLSPSLVADFGSNERLAQLLGFRPESWIPGVWEAIPWSWLVDYFTNVQDILQSLEASVIKPTWIVKTVSTVTTRSVSTRADATLTLAALSSTNARPVTIPSGPLCAYEVIRTDVSRTIPAKLGLPNVQFKLPVEMRQLANMASVLISRRPPPGALRLF